MYDKVRKERQEPCTTNLHQPLPHPHPHPHPPPSTPCFQDFCDCSLIPVCAPAGSGCSNCGSTIYWINTYYAIQGIALHVLSTHPLHSVLSTG